MRKTMLRLSIAVLLIGLTSAGWIYVASPHDEDTDGAYQIQGGFVYPNSTENSKKYIHDLQLYGGRSAVLADRFMRWFSSLWHGTSLAYTVCVISILISLCLYVASRLRHALPVDSRRSRDAQE